MVPVDLPVDLDHWRLDSLRRIQLSLNVFQKLHLPSSGRGIIHLLQQEQQMMEVVNKEQYFRKQLLGVDQMMDIGPAVFCAC